MEMKTINFIPVLEGYRRTAGHARRLLENTFFGSFIMAMALFNCVLISLGTNAAIGKEYSTVLSVCGKTVLAVFLLEILLKLCSGFWKFWKNTWNVIDFVVTMVVIIVPVTTTIDERTVTVLRVILSGRAFVYIRETYMIIHVLQESLPALANMYLLIGGSMLMFGVMGVLLFGEVVPSAFGDLPAALFTLFACLTLDGWVDIQEKFKITGEEFMYGAMVFFAFFIGVGAFLFINLKISVLLANLQRAAEEHNRPPEEPSTVEGLTDPDDVLTSADVTRETPLTNFDNLTAENFENALLIEKHIRKTTSELEDLYEELERIVEEVSAVPENRKHELQWMMESQAAARLEDDILSSEVFSGRTGDILTTLMNLDEAHIIDSAVDTPEVYSYGMLRAGVRRLSRAQVEMRRTHVGTQEGF